MVINLDQLKSSNFIVEAARAGFRAQVYHKLSSTSNHRLNVHDCVTTNTASSCVLSMRFKENFFTDQWKSSSCFSMKMVQWRKFVKFPQWSGGKWEVCRIEVHMQIATRSKYFLFQMKHCIDGHKLGINCKFLDPFLYAPRNAPFTRLNDFQLFTARAHFQFSDKISFLIWIKRILWLKRLMLAINQFLSGTCAI